MVITKAPPIRKTVEYEESKVDLTKPWGLRVNRPDFGMISPSLSNPASTVKTRDRSVSILSTSTKEPMKKEETLMF